MILDIAVVAALLGVIFLMLVYTALTGISPVPTTPQVARTMMALAPSNGHGPIYELGSGWGSLAVAFAKRFPGRQVIAYELSPVPWLASRLWLLLFPRHNLTIYRADFYTQSLADAALVVCYLYPGAMAKLRRKFASELVPGTLIVSNSFQVPEWAPATMRRADDQYASPVFLYEMPSPRGALAKKEPEGRTSGSSLPPAGSAFVSLPSCRAARRFLLPASPKGQCLPW